MAGILSGDVRWAEMNPGRKIGRTDPQEIALVIEGMVEIIRA